jgi:hypothetical protein
MPMATTTTGPLDGVTSDIDGRPHDAALAHAARMVKGEYLEMPGLSLTLRQAMRLWHLDAASCRRVLDALIRCGFLTETRHGAFRRLEG